MTAGRSTARAAVAFYPPADFLAIDTWALVPGGQKGAFCHDPATSPESRLVGCAIQTCAEKVQAANPARYVSPADPPTLILHGGSDPLVPHNQGELLYMALNKACLDSVFVSLPKAGHGPWNGFLTNDATREAATMRSTVPTQSWQVTAPRIGPDPAGSAVCACAGVAANTLPSAAAAMTPRRLVCLSITVPR